jgi:hypothetical protein
LVERGGPWRRLQVVVVDDVQADRSEREDDDPILGAGKGGGAGKEVSDWLHALTVAAAAAWREEAFRHW